MAKKLPVDTLPAELRSGPFLPANVPSGVHPPYYERAAWDGTLQAAKLAYVPSGRFTWRSLVGILLLPAVFVPIAFYVANLPLKLFGWSTVYLDVILLAMVVGGVWSTGAYCRSRWIGGVAGALSGIPMWLVLSALGTLRDPHLVKILRIPEPVSVGDERTFLAAIVWIA